MFSIRENEVIGFESDRSIERNMTNGETQTAPMTLSDKTTATNPTKDRGTQCDIEENIEPITLSVNDAEKLNCWLQNIAPLMLAELDLIEPNEVFNDYELDSENEEDSHKFTITQIINVEKETVSKKELKERENNPISIVSLSWNSVGYTIAAGCGHIYHEDWCDHNGNLFVYSKKGISQNFTPLYDTSINSCVSAISFHPKESGLLAVATVSGEIQIYNMSYHNDGSNREVFVCSDSSLHSGKGISCVYWFDNKQISRYFSKTFSTIEKTLITGGSDGKIIIWTVNLSTSSIIKYICYELRSTLNKKLKLPSDINCMDFSRIFTINKNVESNISYNEREDADDYFVIGCKTGELLLCRTSTARLNESSNYDPFVDYLESHKGCILSINFSTEKPRILSSLGTDREIKIFNILTNSPIRIIHLENEFSCLKWIPSKDSLVIGSISKNTNLFPLRIYDTENGNEISLKNFMNEKIEKKYGQCKLEFHNTNLNLLAYGDVSGKITIMEIPFKHLS